MVFELAMIFRKIDDELLDRALFFTLANLEIGLIPKAGTYSAAKTSL